MSMFTLFEEKMRHSTSWELFFWHSERPQIGILHSEHLTTDSGEPWILNKHDGQTGAEFGAGPERIASSIRIVSPLRICFVATRHLPFSLSTVKKNYTEC